MCWGVSFWTGMKGNRRNKGMKRDKVVIVLLYFLCFFCLLCFLSKELSSNPPPSSLELHPSGRHVRVGTFLLKMLSGRPTLSRPWSGDAVTHLVIQEHSVPAQRPFGVRHGRATFSRRQGYGRQAGVPPMNLPFPQWYRSPSDPVIGRAGTPQQVRGSR